MELNNNEMLSQNKKSTSKTEDNISTLDDAVSSLIHATSQLQTLKDSETNALFNNLIFGFPKEGIDFHKTKKLYEINLIKQALRQTKGHQRKAAKLLNIKTSTLNSIIKRHNL